MNCVTPFTGTAGFIRIYLEVQVQLDTHVVVSWNEHSVAVILYKKCPILLL